MCKGFKQISNDFFESDYWRQSRTYNESEALLDIMYQVRFEASERSARIGGREVTWGQAEWPASVRFLATRWKWTDRHVRTFLSSLRRKGVIETNDSQGVSVIRLKKYLILADTRNDTESDTANNLNMNELVAQVTQQLTQQLTQQNSMPQTRKSSERHSSDTKHNNGDNSLFPPLSPKGETMYDWSLLSDEMKVVAEEWLKYKREKKQTYKPSGFKTFCKHLIELSGNNPSVARLIIEQSMANNYSGIFKLKDKEHEATTGNRTNGAKAAPTDQQLIFDTYDLINEARTRETNSDF